MTVDLRTRYLGMELANPLVPSASPLTGDLATLVRFEEYGAGAVVLPSLFEEQIEHEELELQRLYEYGAGSFAEALGGYFPELGDYRTGPGEYLKLVEDARRDLSIPVIGSLNGTSPGGWVKYARKIEEAGASALELNIYLIPTDPEATGEDVERRYLELVAEVRGSISIPLAVKVGPYFSSMAHMAGKLVAAGADGLVLFNRFYQPDIDLEDLRVEPSIRLSTEMALRLPLRWIAILKGRVGASLALTSGVHGYEDAIKALLVGADVVMMASALLRMGPDHVAAVLNELRWWMEENEYDSVEQLKGSMSRESAPDPEAFERANYMRALTSYTGPYV